MLKKFFSSLISPQATTTNEVELKVERKKLFS
jgi:hypothetical protein